VIVASGRHCVKASLFRGTLSGQSNPLHQFADNYVTPEVMTYVDYANVAANPVAEICALPKMCYAVEMFSDFWGA
jgi:hypothetical protein